jgi:ribosomal protein L21E
MARTSKAAKQTKVKKVMKEYKTGTLHSGKGGPVVKSRQQAIAIAMSEAGMKKKTTTKMKAHSPKGEYKSAAAKKKHEKMEPKKMKMMEKKMGRSS